MRFVFVVAFFDFTVICYDFACHKIFYESRYCFMDEFVIRICESPSERSLCYALRHLVFVDEQGVPLSLERDEHDELDAVHFGGFFGDDLIATGRLLVNGSVGKIGRVAVSIDYRSGGYGRLLMQSMIDHCSSLGLDSITLNAQLAVINFYERLGFVGFGSDYIEAGIMHRPMSLALSEVK